MLKFFGAMGKMVFKLVSWGMDNVLTGVGNIFGDKDPGQTNFEKAFEAMFGVFKIIGGMASFWLASRMMMPWKLLRTPGRVQEFAPNLGQHNVHVMRELLGISESEIKLLEERDVIGTGPVDR